MSSRISRLRKKQAQGLPLTDDQKEFLAANPRKGPQGRKPQFHVLEVVGSEGGEPDAVSPEAATEIPPTEFDASDAGFQRPAPEVPPIPSREPGGKKNAPKGDWRNAYRIAGAATTREATCVELATAGKLALYKLNQITKSLGDEPVFTSELIEKEFFPAAVLTIDMALPERIVVTPQVKFAIGVGITAGQCAISIQKAKKAGKWPPKKKPEAPPSQGLPPPVIEVVDATPPTESATNGVHEQPSSRGPQTMTADLFKGTFKR